MLFDVDHIYISYLKIGTITDEFKGTYELNSTYWEDGNPKALKKFISKQDKLEIKINEDSIPNDFQWINEDNIFHSSKDSCDLKLDLDFFINESKKEFHLRKQDFKVLELYKSYNTCLYFKDGRIEFKIYNKKFNVIAKHIICDDYNNTIRERYHLNNKALLQLLRKFNSKDEITLQFDIWKPLVIRSEDYIGILAPRILYEEAYGTTDGLTDTLGGD